MDTRVSTSSGYRDLVGEEKKNKLRKSNVVCGGWHRSVPNRSVGDCPFSSIIFFLSSLYPSSTPLLCCQSRLSTLLLALVLYSLYDSFTATSFFICASSRFGRKKKRKEKKKKKKKQNSIDHVSCDGQILLISNTIPLTVLFSHVISLDVEIQS